MLRFAQHDGRRRARVRLRPKAALGGSGFAWAFYDFLPTCAEPAGVTLPADAKPDGISVLPVLLGGTAPQPAVPLLGSRRALVVAGGAIRRREGGPSGAGCRAWNSTI